MFLISSLVLIIFSLNITKKRPVINVPLYSDGIKPHNIETKTRFNKSATHRSHMMMNDKFNYTFSLSTPRMLITIQKQPISHQVPVWNYCDDFPSNLKHHFQSSIPYMYMDSLSLYIKGYINIQKYITNIRCIRLKHDVSFLSLLGKLVIVSLYVCMCLQIHHCHSLYQP